MVGIAICVFVCLSTWVVGWLAGRNGYRRGLEDGLALTVCGDEAGSYLALPRRGQDERVMEARRRRAHLARHVDGEVLRILEERFGTRLPAFQGRPGEWDALDAMRRDSQREVVLYLRQQLELAGREGVDED